VPSDNAIVLILLAVAVTLIMVFVGGVAFGL
jgi:hypothetical protein